VALDFSQGRVFPAMKGIHLRLQNPTATFEEFKHSFVWNSSHSNMSFKTLFARALADAKALISCTAFLKQATAETAP
jgi:hypothetical protein